jgi:hypothetical protein
MTTARIYFRNEDNADVYLTVVDEYANRTVLDEEFLADGATKDGDFELSGSDVLLSWQCYRRDNEDKTGGEDSVEASAGSTVEISTD